jgi:hypothetical protein
MRRAPGTFGTSASHTTDDEHQADALSVVPSLFRLTPLTSAK